MPFAYSQLAANMQLQRQRKDEIAKRPKLRGLIFRFYLPFYIPHTPYLIPYFHARNTA
jgi:hypothetical protein